MKRRKRDEELIGVILSDCETLARRIDYFDATETLSLAIGARKVSLLTTRS